MEYLGHTQTASYTTGPRTAQSACFLPAVGAQKTFDTMPGPSPLRRSLTSLPWRPSTYYQTAKVSPTTALMQSQSGPLSARANLAELEGIKVPPVFSAARNALYTRYTPNDWMSANLSNYSVSDRVRGNAERIRYDTLRLCREGEDRTKRAQEESGKRLGERVTDINFWKTELQHETDNMVTEISSLQEAKRIAEKALGETENPLHVAQECLYNREKRQGIDLVHDLVEKDLLREVDVIKQCQDKIRAVIDKANVQLNLNRAAQHELEKDTADKFSAQHLDEKCHGLRNASGGIAFHNGIEQLDRTLSVPETWAKFSNENIQRSQAERAASKNLRAELDKVLNDCANDMWKQFNCVNTALSERVQECTDARNKLQTHLGKVLQEVFDMEKNIEFLKKSIKDKEAPYQVAQTRLETRIHRPNVELCRDPAQHRLVSEVQEIRETVEQLQAKLREAENALQHLLKTKSALEHDLSVKNNSLFIDREKCLGIRKTFPMAPRGSY
ncbi:hypothetical protein BOX15_Mlig003606g3 [Macrostomum lignano]|uniref:Tektin n=1 Tax=Macrostomum lignano TaxID=282301 RepID=A0A267GV76_9PLAT|nr:hypothetical protein BOX15_Mlig003606g3 [Macrostomum lignano]